MKCPKCNSANTRKVWVHEPNWHVGHEICKDCGHQDHWGLFCDPPIDFNLVFPPVIVDTGESDD